MSLLTDIAKGMAKIALGVEEHNFPELTEYRLETCRGCKYFRPKNSQCGVCGCFMDVKAKLTTNRNPDKAGRIEVTHCPEGFWGDAHIANMYRQIDGKEPIQINDKIEHKWHTTN